MRQFPKAFGFAAVLLLTSMHAASAFSASFSWSGIRACGRTSPAFTIQDAPEGTERLRFVMIDKDAKRRLWDSGGLGSRVAGVMWCGMRHKPQLVRRTVDRLSR
jgi:phosphatidylethanolamine-binding protein (PEBP) family uncharacterized protein